ncbi:hypothetical protein Tco_0162375 [Tanacetum coccineum]
MEKEKSVENNMVVDKNIVELSELDIVDPIELVDKEEEIKDKIDDESARSTNEKLIGCRQPKILESPCRVDEITEDEIDPVAPTNTVWLFLVFDLHVIFDEEKLGSS